MAENPEDLLKELEFDALGDLSKGEGNQPAVEASLSDLDAALSAGPEGTGIPILDESATLGAAAVATAEGGAAKPVKAKGKKKGDKKKKKKKSRFKIVNTIREKWEKRFGKKEKKQRVSLKERLKQIDWKRWTLVEMAKAMGSKDVPTRLMALFFFFCMFGALHVVRTGWVRYQELHQKKVTMDRLERDELEEKSRKLAKSKAEIASRKLASVEMGVFTFHVTPAPSANLAPGVANEGELEITLLCDSEQTAEFIKKYKTRFHDSIVEAVSGLDRDDLLGYDGKKRLKREIMIRVNKWLGEKGHVSDVFFSKFLVT